MTPAAQVMAPVRPSRRISISQATHSHGHFSYLELGDPANPAVMLIHGFGADLLTWQLCLVPLAQHYRVIAVDLPGHGRTTADVGAADLAFMTGWLDEVFDRLGMADGHIVGHSMGAKIALGFALAHPHRVASLALIAPAGLGGEFHHNALDAFLAAPDEVNAGVLAAHLLGPSGDSLRTSLAVSLYTAAGDDDRRDAMHKLLGQAKAYGLALSPEGFDWSKIRVPVKLMWGDHDRLIPMPKDRYLPPVQIIAGAGHLPHMEASGVVVAALKEFLP